MHWEQWSDILSAYMLLSRVKNVSRYTRGISVVEIIIATGIISLFMIYISQSYANFVYLSAANIAKIQASFLLDEGVEAVKTIRAESWSKIPMSGTYYLYWNTNRWSATSTPRLVDNIFLRTLVFSSVNRDASFNIASGGTGDSDSRKVDLSVAWLDKGATTTKSISMYVFNIFN
jgi:hypothetical protein